LTNYDVTNLALKSDLNIDKTELQTVDTQLLNALGGTLRQCLCVKESLNFDNTDVIDLGSLVWYYDTTGTYPFFKTNISNIKQQDVNILKILSSKYTSYGAIAESPFKQNSYNRVVRQTTSSTQIMIQDATYTDATTFKNAMKNVLLAYEKA
jgi:hypothetical protein